MATEQTIERLNALLHLHTHRTHDGESLWRSDWDESWVLREIALDTLKRLRRKGEPIYFILDDTRALKQAKTITPSASSIVMPPARAGRAIRS